MVRILIGRIDAWFWLDDTKYDSELNDALLLLPRCKEVSFGGHWGMVKFEYKTIQDFQLYHKLDERKFNNLLTENLKMKCRICVHDFPACGQQPRIKDDYTIISCNRFKEKTE